MSGIIFRNIRLALNNTGWKGFLPHKTVLTLNITKSERDFYETLDFMADGIERKLGQISTSPKFITAIRDSTHFHRAFDEWNITDTIRQHNINGIDVFISLVSKAAPTGMGRIEHENFDDSYYRGIFQQKILSSSNYVCFDYLNGIRMKNCFPVNNKTHETSIDVRRFEGGDAITRIGSLISKNLDVA